MRPPASHLETQEGWEQVGAGGHYLRPNPRLYSPKSRRKPSITRLKSSLSLSGLNMGPFLYRFVFPILWLQDGRLPG